MLVTARWPAAVDRGHGSSYSEDKTSKFTATLLASAT
jgi:hypothetical protein